MYTNYPNKIRNIGNTYKNINFEFKTKKNQKPTTIKKVYHFARKQKKKRHVIKPNGQASEKKTRKLRQKH